MNVAVVRQRQKFSPASICLSCALLSERQAGAELRIIRQRTDKSISVGSSVTSEKTDDEELVFPASANLIS